MRRRAAVIDTNVFVAALLTGDPGAPTARILDGMVLGSFPFVLSVALLAEYRQVLLRERIRRRHGLTEDQIDGILTAIAANAIVREAVDSAVVAPDPGDQFLWDLLAAVPDAVLVTGDTRLLDADVAHVSAVNAEAFVEHL